MQQRIKVDVIIPTYKPDRSLRDLVRMLLAQSYPVDHILIVNTGEEYWDNDLLPALKRVEVFHITKRDFDHAATRNMGVGFSDADYLLFMTQDAVPANEFLVERLLESFSDPAVKAAYGRQLPKPGCFYVEGCVRNYNYPSNGWVRTIRDLPEHGVKTYFCSNVCAMYERYTFDRMGGFKAPAIFNEDMVYAARIEYLGYGVAYVADAAVYHSHNYTNTQQFRRNFDNGVSQAMHPEIFGAVPSAGEGRKMVRYVTKYLWRKGHAYLIPGFYWQCGCRLAGFRLGKAYRHLPDSLVRFCSLSPDFFRRKR